MFEDVIQYINFIREFWGKSSPTIHHSLVKKTDLPMKIKRKVFSKRVSFTEICNQREQNAGSVYVTTSIPTDHS